MNYTYRIMTININGIASATRHHLLEDFLRKHDVDIALLQEVTTENNITFKGYQTVINIGTSARGTAILSKVDLPLHRVERIPSGRGLVTYYGNMCTLNIYAPSGTSNRAEKEAFFSTEIMKLIPHFPTELIMAGDFDCVLSNSDCTRRRTSSRALERLIQGLRLFHV